MTFWLILTTSNDCFRVRRGLEWGWDQGLGLGGRVQVRSTGIHSAHTIVTNWELQECVCVFMMDATDTWQHHPAPAVRDKLWLVRNDACKPKCLPGTEAHQHQKAGRMLSKHAAVPVIWMHYSVFWILFASGLSVMDTNQPNRSVTEYHNEV